MQYTAGEICELIQGELIGDSTTKINKLAKIEEAQEDAVTFLANLKYLPFLNTTNAGVIILNKGTEITENKAKALILVDDAYSSFTTLLQKFQEDPNHHQGIHPLAFISPSAKIGEKCYIGPFVFIGENVTISNNTKIYSNVSVGDQSKIGADSLIFSGVRIYHNVEIGNQCILHSGCVIGSDGFGFAPQADGSYKKVPQTGNVIIEDAVEIGANSTIDRATIGSTFIRKGVKIDNLVHIAHNVEIGENTVIAGQAGISGSTKLDKQCVVGGQVGFAGHLYIASGSQFGAQSGVAKSISKPNGKWFGTPVNPYKDTMRIIALNKNLPELEKRIQALEQLLKDKV